jgi:hypothetical protein
MPGDTEIRYDGSACVNLRSVTSACDLLVPASANKPLSWSELSAFLWFVETCVTSRRLFFDGTVPREVTERALNQLEDAKAKHDLAVFEVSPITFKAPRDVLNAARDALAESTLLLDNFQFDAAADAPVPQEQFEKFSDQLRLVTAISIADREALALSWVSESESFLGSKCLAALVANGDGALKAASMLYEKHASQGALVTGALINRFRLNYVNQLASRHRSAYIPNPSFENLTKDHVRLFKDYLLQRLVKKLKVSPGESNVLVENMRAETPLPPIGLYALMATRAKGRPGAVLETAYNEFRQDDALMKVIWQNTKGGIAKSKGSAAEVRSNIEGYFYDRYKTLEKEADGIKTLTSRARSVRTYLIPAILKGAAKAIPGAWELGGVVYEVLRETALEASIPLLGDLLLQKGCDSYISQYKSLKWDLENDDAVKMPLARLSEQVEYVFARPLQWN